jgi:hypothetical protein
VRQQALEDQVAHNVDSRLVPTKRNHLSRTEQRGSAGAGRGGVGEAGEPCANRLRGIRSRAASIPDWFQPSETISAGPSSAGVAGAVGRLIGSKVIPLGWKHLEGR